MGPWCAWSRQFFRMKKKLMQNAGSTLGDVPAQDFVLFMLQQYLPLEEYNANIETIVAKTEVAYTPSTTEAFLHGLTTGSAGPAEP